MPRLGKSRLKEAKRIMLEYVYTTWYSYSKYKDKVWTMHIL